AWQAKSGECRLGRLGRSHAEGGTTPGVFVHAAAVHSVLTGDLIRLVPLIGRASAAVLASAGGSLLGFAVAPWLAVLGVAALAATRCGPAGGVLAVGSWFRVTVPAAAASGSMVLAYLVRFLVEERRRRRVQYAFSHCLAPSIV